MQEEASLRKKDIGEEELSADVKRILHYSQLFKILLVDYDLCIGCVYRTFSLMTPKMYSDIVCFTKMGQRVLAFPIVEGQSALNKKFGDLMEQADKHYGSSNFICWLCSGILQTPFLSAVSQQVTCKIMEEQYHNKSKYKLNVKVDTILTIKHLTFLNFLSIELRRYVEQQFFSEEHLCQIVKDVINPHLDKNGGLELKTVFKWAISNTINQQDSQKMFTLTSTINEDQNTVIVGLDIDYKGQRLAKMLEGMLGSMMHLNAVPSKPNKYKKVKIDLADASYAIKWNANLVQKIITIDPKAWGQSYHKYLIRGLRESEEAGIEGVVPQEIAQKIEEDPEGAEFLTNNKFKKKKPEKEKQMHHRIETKLELQSEHIYLCGRYVKFSRYLSQTPWIVNKQRLTESSLQEEVQKQILRFFFPEQIALENIEIKFHAGGREDIDVRMLKGGRPFVLELVNPRKSFTELTIQTLMTKIRQKIPEKIVASLGEVEKQVSEKMDPQDLQKVKQGLLEFLINNTTDLAKVFEFKRTTAAYISNELKQAEMEKIKHYVCYIKSQREPFKKQDKDILEQQHNLKIVQKTPLRVLHRRTLMYREKMVHKMIYHPVSQYSAVVEIWASAGTYIKEFVHGDMNRTLPNVGTLLGKGVDILQLDVGSLKQGEWEEGADQEMQLGQLAWEKNGP